MTRDDLARVLAQLQYDEGAPDGETWESLDESSRAWLTGGLVSRQAAEVVEFVAAWLADHGVMLGSPWDEDATVVWREEMRE